MPTVHFCRKQENELISRQSELQQIMGRKISINNPGLIRLANRYIQKMKGNVGRFHWIVEIVGRDMSFDSL